MCHFISGGMCEVESLNGEPLWEDIRTVAERRLQKRDTRPHFLGAIVLEQVGSMPVDSQNLMRHGPIAKFYLRQNVESRMACFSDIPSDTRTTPGYENVSSNPKTIDDNALS